MADSVVVTPNAFQGSDAERINQAIEAAVGAGAKVVIPRWNHAERGKTETWLLDAAILLRSNTTLVLDNCRIKLSDRCRDNMLRSANCGLGTTEIEPISNIHIRGVGTVVLQKMSRVLFYCLVLFLVTGVSAADYFVGPNGDDSNPGTEEKPWQTIVKAAKTLEPGDTVYIMNGTYRERVSPGTSGLPGKPIVYAVCPGHRAVIDGTGVALAKRGGILGLVDIANKRHLRISGLHIVNTLGRMDAGIFVANSESITLERNRIANTGTSGICTWQCKDFT